MPYIDKQSRIKFETILQDFEETLKENDLSAGDMNYLISSMLHKYSTKNEPNYSKYNEIIGLLECAKMEFYRRLISNYEDVKINTNGDVFKI